MNGYQEPVQAPRDRARVWKTPANVTLCALEEIAEPGSRGFVLQIGEAFFHGFVVRHSGEVRGYIDRCPHVGFPLAIELDKYLLPDGSLILCGWHCAVFEPLTGACVGGPAAGGRLTPWPVKVGDGMIRTGEPLP